MPFPLLTSIIFLPLLGGLLILFTPKERTGTIKAIATAATGLALLLAVALVLKFDCGGTAMQFVERLPWIPQIHINYYLGVDGISIGLCGNPG